jgi:hypothetical protein
MAQTLPLAIAALQTKAAGLTGIKLAPTSPPESTAVYPFAVCYARLGQETPQSSGWSIGLHTLVCEIHLSRANLPVAITAALPYYELFRSAVLGDPTLTGTVQAVNQLRYEFGAMKYAGVETIGWQIQVDIKLLGSY